MKQRAKKQLEELRRRYPAGTRLRLIHMADDPHPVPDGTLGTVQYVDDIGNIGMKWDNGQSLNLICTVDTFEVISTPQQTKPTPKKGGDAR